MDQQNRKKLFPESAVRVIAWDGPVRATAKAITAGLILVLIKRLKTVLFGCCFSSQRRSRKKRKSIHFSPPPAACEGFAG